MRGRSLSLTIWRRKRAKPRERETTATRPYRALLPPYRALHSWRRGRGEECVCEEKRAKSRGRETTAFSAYRALFPPNRERLLPLLHACAASACLGSSLSRFGGKRARYAEKAVVSRPRDLARFSPCRAASACLLPPNRALYVWKRGSGEGCVCGEEHAFGEELVVAVCSVCCRVLQCVAVCCSVVQCVVIHSFGE